MSARVCVCLFFSHTHILSSFLYLYFIFLSIHYIVGSLTSPPTAPPTSPLTAKGILFPTECQTVARLDVSPSTSPLTSPLTAPRLASDFGTIIQSTESQSITLSSRDKYTTKTRRSGSISCRKKNRTLPSLRNCQPKANCNRFFLQKIEPHPMRNAVSLYRV